MWGKGGKMTRGSGKKEAMLQVWGGRAQEVGVSKRKQEENGRGGIPMRSMGKDKGALWGKRTAT